MRAVWRQLKVAALAESLKWGLRAGEIKKGANLSQVAIQGGSDSRSLSARARTLLAAVRTASRYWGVRAPADQAPYNVWNNLV